ncbi:TetR/AcrR family transcriptional regulator [Kitasatospora sp. NPDC096147]|uniref:TetR/AcrR family transcriptional regulator n=1 Tax=Kitasatospora sp. NPDC096147 TaxID=3364093 RepID=UPI00381B27DB
MSTTQRPRTGTRGRIIDVALELFSEQGYQETSLREIADRLGVTKAALYYHFKTKDDIVHGIIEQAAAPIDEVIAWGEEQEWSPEVRDELIRRFAAGSAERAPLLRFFHENQPALRDSSAGLEFKERMIAMIKLVHGPEATPAARLRAAMALFSFHTALFLLKQDLAAGPEALCATGTVTTLDQATEVALEVALEIAARIDSPRD